MSIGTAPRGRPRLTDIAGPVGDAALELASEVGYNKATLDRIALRAGLAKTTLYRHWSTKEYLFVAAIAQRLGSPDLAVDDGPASVARRYVEWIIGRLSVAGMGAALAGVYVEAVADADLRAFLVENIRQPHVQVLTERLDVDAQTTELMVDMIVGAAVHHFGTTGTGYDTESAAALTNLILRAAGL